MELTNLLPKVLAETIAKPSAMLPTITAKVDWRGFDPADAKLREMLAAAQRFADEIASGMPPRWLTYTGKPGIGKTHLARSLWKWFDVRGCWYTETAYGTGARLGRPGRFSRWRSVASDLRNGAWSAVDDLVSQWFLCIDDIGAEHQGGTGAVLSALERLLDDRLGKWTVITCNLSHRDIAASLGARIASRLIREGNLIVDGKDQRDYNLR